MRMRAKKVEGILGPASQRRAGALPRFSAPLLQSRFPMPKTTRPTRSRAPKAERSDVLAVELRKREREVIAEYLGKHHGHVGETAKVLGLTRRALERKMEAHGLREEAAKAREQANIGGPRST